MPTTSITPSVRRTTRLLTAAAGLLTLWACNDDSCPTAKTASYLTMGEVQSRRIELLDEALARSRVELGIEQRAALERDGHLYGVVLLDRPVKHPDGSVEMPGGWLPDLAAGHPWSGKLGPGDDAFYSRFQERVLDALLFDPRDPEHVAAAGAYLDKAHEGSPFVGWTSFSTPTECPKRPPPME